MRGRPPGGGGSPPAMKASILIVDDRPDKRLVLQAILEDLQQNVVAANSGEEALKCVLQQDFAVILLDVNMPGLDGLETAALIRSRKRSAHIPIIFITADYNDEIHSAKGYSLGAVDYIISPVVPEILRTKVKVFVDLYLLAEQAKRQAEEHIALAEERVARAAAERANQRSAFLAQASAALGSLDIEATARELVRACVPFLADVAMVCLPGREGFDARIDLAWTVHGAKPCEHIEVPEIRSNALSQAVERVIGTGTAETITGNPLRRMARESSGEITAGMLGIPAQFALDALMLVPMTVGARALGSLVLAMGATGRRFDADALALATDVASRGATALENARLYRKIRDEDQRKNEFLAMLAHELRNPLAPISNAMHVLEGPDIAPERLAWAKDVVGRQLKQLVRLVDDLLDVSRITRGKIQLRIETVDVQHVIAAAVETSRPFIDAMEHEVIVSVPSDPLFVRGDSARVAQVLANLVTNAAKYTEKHGRIDISAAREAGEVVFRVRDTGVGIPKEALSTIFELFTQVDHTLDRSRGGLGIGLTLVRRLVEMQGGTVQAYSAGDGQGSEFTVRLPLAEVKQEIATPQPAEALPHPLASTVKVLIVDDNHDVAESTAMLLRMVGCEVEVAFDGAVALESIDTMRPDAVLLDIGLPGMNGYEVAERIRAQPEYAHTLLVAVSGYGQEDHRQQSKRAGFDYHIVKPIDPAMMADLLSTLPGTRPTTPRTVTGPGARTWQPPA
ncbi:MAG TPA: response regulator [Casimicrobiaceae bacterium]|nr:response regulator [Casimicrobiaceae bacterium]